ncbi:GAF domain-containing protein [Agreia pratensis]|uniref:helix-turn-helix domain-containing protein n=1 Tax=Agreia pratensis TaxID=150121 RepID=UPI00188C44BE|nr:helix-turn-helix domain-containing protein [Agreia pratensis]MBF4635275.1 GAF domain-containing protein [Agreia pratensis]
MTSPWLAQPEAALKTPRPLVRASWKRAFDNHLDPDLPLASLEVAEDELGDYRLAHPLASVLPVIRRLLVRDADDDSGLLVAVGDAMGRLLWVDGDRALRRRAEGMLFVEGAGWAESRVGTSAPGTALELDHAVQISGGEHFNRLAHAWSCTAVPVHDPETRRILGMIDITGGTQAVDPHTLPLMEATAAAVESELMVQRLRALRDRPAPRRPTRRAVTVARPVLRVLGRDTGELSSGTTRVELSARHTELLTLLAWHRQGLSANRLAELVYTEGESAVTLRAEMVRLRRALAGSLDGLGLESRPYRLTQPLELDAQHVVGLLDRGAHRVALATAAGAVLPGSTAPGIEQIREEIRARIRESVLSDASVDVLLQYAQTPDAANDTEVWSAILRLLPRRSPKRAGIVAHLEVISG